MKTKKYLSILKDIHLLLFIIFSLFITQKFFQPGYASTFDGPYHYISLENFYSALTQGQFPVRWVQWPQSADNLSMPVYNFYPPGFYYFTSAVKTILNNTQLAIKVSVYIFWISGAFFIYKLTRKKGLAPALNTAVIFILNPYILVNIFVRGAYPEVMGIALLTASLYFTNKFANTGINKYLILLAFFYSLVIISHPISAIIFSPVLAGYAIYFGFKKKSLSIVLKIIVSLILGIFLSAFYLIPSLAEKGYIHSELAYSGYNNYRIHFPHFSQLFSRFWGYGPSVEGVNDGMSFQLGYIEILTFTSAVIYLIYTILKRRKLAGETFFWLVCFVYGVFFMLKNSQIFWDNLKFLWLLQFPWRFLQVISITGPLLAAVLTEKIAKKAPGLPLILSFAALILSFPYLRVNNPLNETKLKSYSYFDRIYYPRFTNETPINSSLISYSEGVKDVAVRSAKPHKITIALSCDKESNLIYNTPYFPGWKAYLNGNETDITKSNNFAFMKVKISDCPALITFKFSDTLPRKIGNFISVFVLLSLSIGYIYLHKYERKKIS